MKNVMTKLVATTEAGLDKRRTTRVVQAIPIKVEGVDALAERFTENTSTVMVSCHGCKYQSKYYVPKGSVVTVEIPRYDPAAGPRVVAGKVIWVQRPAQAREILHIGLEFETAGNVWDLASPPRDWFPLPGEQMFTPPAPKAIPELPVSASPDSVEIVTWDESEIGATSRTEERAPAVTREQAPPEDKKRPMLSAAPLATEATAEGIGVIRAKVDAQLHDVIEEALTASIDRLSESAVQRIVQQSAERSAQIAEETRKALDAAISELDAKLDAKLNAKLDEKIKKAVEEAASKLSENRQGKSKYKK